MGSTPVNAIPYPEGTDFLAQGAAAIEALADRVETLIGQRGVYGLGTFVGSPADTLTSPTINFPVPFTAPPVVRVNSYSLSSMANQITKFQVHARNVTTTGFQIVATAVDGVAREGNLMVAWEATE